MYFILLLSIILILGALAVALKPQSVYANEPDAKNPMQGKMVRFVEKDDEPKNADGISGHLEVIGESSHHANAYETFVKRGIDVTLSLCGLIILSPVYALVALFIVIDDPGPVCFTQKRLGKDKQYFKLHKFRSMKMCTPKDKPTHMLENPEQYITRAGRFIRAHSLDELPQIWDIFIGNMSIIGPRPGLWNQDFLTAERDKWHANDVKPGLTGWAQINGRDELEIPQKSKFDGEYVAKLSQGGWKAFCFDLKCFFGTIGPVFRASGINEGKKNSEQ